MSVLKRTLHPERRGAAFVLLLRLARSGGRSPDARSWPPGFRRDPRTSLVSAQKQPDSADLLAKLALGRTAVRFAKEKAIYGQGDAADAVFFISKGRVKITVMSEQGKEAVVAILSKNEFFGEGCLTAQRRRIATATA